MMHNKSSSFFNDDYQNPKRTLFQVIQDVHMTTNGSYDRDEAEQFKDVRLLQNKHNQWVTGNNDSQYDFLVKRLIGQTLIDAYDKLGISIDKTKLICTSTR